MKDLEHFLENTVWSQGIPNRKGGLRKIAEPSKEERCLSPEHNPPMHIVLSPGTYEYTCPSCGHTVTFTVPLITF